MFVATVIVSCVIALAAFGSGLAKLAKQPKLVENLTKLNVPLSWLPLLAAAEIAGAIGVVIGLKVAPLGIAAGIGLVAYFVGAVAAHLKASDKEIAPPLVFALIAVAAVALRIVTS